MEILTVRHCEQKYVAVSVMILMCENNVRPRNVNPFHGDPATCSHFDQTSLAVLVVSLMCGRFDQNGVTVLVVVLICGNFDQRSCGLLVVAILVATSFVALVGVAFLGCGLFDQDPKLAMFKHR